MEHSKVVGTCDLRQILNAHDIKVVCSPPNSTQNVVIEIFVREPLSLAFLPGQQTLTQTNGPPFRMSRKKFFFLAFPSPQILRQLRAVFQVVSDHLIDVGQSQTRVPLNDLLSSGTAIERMHDKIERDTRATDAINARCVSRQRNRVGKRRHASIVSPRRTDPQAIVP